MAFNFEWIRERVRRNIREQKIAEKKWWKWSQVMAFNFEWIRERRKIPPSKQLFARVKTVIDLFANKIYCETKSPLFKDRIGKRRIRFWPKRGDYSDPAGAVPFFYWKTTPDG
jgi:hypothetical protein